MVLYNDVSKPWKIYIDEFEFSKVWSFLPNQKDNKMQLKRDNIMIWNLIGPIICKYYQTVEKSMIKFTQAD
jgi:uncharacterized protein with von Willebrand factor type A (vWA) domain